jgi:hypothetical protein
LDRIGLVLRIITYYIYLRIKMKLLVVSILLLIVYGCRQGSVPVITGRNTVRPAISLSVYAGKGTVQEDTVAGRMVFMARCNRCHGLPRPEAYNTVMWEAVLLRMIPRSRIDTVNAVHLKAYVLANAVRNE